MKLHLIRIILIILLMGTFFMIFCFSNQNGQQSGGLSKKITEEVTKNIETIQKLEKTYKEKKIKQIESIIRKLAHFSIYTLVGMLLMGLFSTYSLQENSKISLSMIIGIVYASSDEIHQAFIPERAASILDVGIDSMGVLLGILCILLFIKLK